MRREFWMAALLLPLSSCYPPPADPGYGYAQPGYPPPGYPPGGYAATPYDQGGYVASPYDQGGYPGYSYNDGAPTYFAGGVAVPLVFFGGEWGFYDHERHWHRAPDRVAHDLEAHRAGGGQFHPGAPPPRSDQPWHGQPGGPAGFRPGEQPRSAPPQAAFHSPEQPRPAPPQAAFHPPEQPRPATPGFAAPAAAQQRHEEHNRGRDCPPGQRC